MVKVVCIRYVNSIFGFSGKADSGENEEIRIVVFQRIL